MKISKKIKDITYISLFIALIIVASKIEIRVSDFRFHFGNALCLLASFMLMPVEAGLASGIGSMLFDILFYTSGLGCIITFFTKFVMGFVSSLIFNKILKNSDKIVLNLVISGVFGELSYIILYLLKTYIERRFVLSLDISVVLPILWVKLIASVVNAIIAIISSIILYKILKNVQKRPN